MPVEDVRAKCLEVIKKISPPIILMRDISFSKEYFQKLHYEIPVNYALKNIYDNFWQSFWGYVPDDYNYNPHLSILYSDINIVRAWFLKTKNDARKKAHSQKEIFFFSP